MDKNQRAAGKRPREEPKRAAERNGEHRAARMKPSRETRARQNSQSLSSAEYAVLSVFRTYLMTPGKMLCFTSNLEAFHAPLAQLTGKGLLVAERFRGGYSLTERGYTAMQDAQ